MIAIVVLIAGFTLLTAMVICAPHWISDSNSFLTSFVGVELLSALGVILAITLASLAQLHLALNRSEERRQERYLGESRDEIKSSARWLIGLYIAAAGVVIVKPLVGTAERATATMNSAAILILAFYVLILIDIMSAVFSLEPEINGQDDTGNGSEDGKN